MLRSTIILTRNVIFAAAITSNSTDRPLSPNGVKLPLETTGGSNYVAWPLFSDGMDAPYYGVMCARMEFDLELQIEGASTMDITTIGFDLAKTAFQVHGADGKGRPVLRRKLRRAKVLAFFAELPSCLVGMEACASAHYWSLRCPQQILDKVRLI